MRAEGGPSRDACYGMIKSILADAMINDCMNASGLKHTDLLWQKIHSGLESELTRMKQDGKPVYGVDQSFCSLIDETAREIFDIDIQHLRNCWQ